LELLAQLDKEFDDVSMEAANPNGKNREDSIK
jgi:hypothetical protein